MYKNECNNNCTCSMESTIITGNSLELDVNYCESEIRADIVVSEFKSVRLWGQVINCDGRPIPNALVKLLKVECYGKHISYKGIAHTISDCEGFYQFDLCGNADDDDCYKLLVSKAAYGPERIIPVSNNNCEPCENRYDPCREYTPITSPPASCSCHRQGCDCGYSAGYYTKSRY
ncbi:MULTISPECIES: hypothetical protein [Peptostreptococcaceae]|uniref:hypothetical protein n=1 Tax=Peptostreptococcaceae TaxID=186804 RepID=UPI003F2C0C07